MSAHHRNAATDRRIAESAAVRESEDILAGLWDGVSPRLYCLIAAGVGHTLDAHPFRCQVSLGRVHQRQPAALLCPLVNDVVRRCAEVVAAHQLPEAVMRNQGNLQAGVVLRGFRRIGLLERQELVLHGGQRREWRQGVLSRVHVEYVMRSQGEARGDGDVVELEGLCLRWPETRNQEDPKHGSRLNRWRVGHGGKRMIGARPELEPEA
mmetsp:Transcript_65175/g.204239  ORF Transcript_65175/g.204239 Transcript_65175/m.204239 type:complete len:209 (-) Transcript_65175:7-633(-)